MDARAMNAVRAWSPLLSASGHGVPGGAGNSSGGVRRNSREDDAGRQPVGYAALVCGVLRERFAMLRGAEKLLARAAKVSPRTAENWLRGECAPNGEALLSLMAECDELALAILAEVARRRAARAPAGREARR
jgi:hypothetical protein